MKVTIITSYAKSAVNFRGPLIRCLVGNHCTVEILAPDHSFETRADLSALGASSISFSMNRTGRSLFQDLLSCQSLYSILIKTKPDVVFTYFIKPNIWGGLAAAAARVPWRVSLVEGLGSIFTKDEHSRQSPGKFILSWLVLRLYQVSFFFANKIVFLNSDDLHELSDSCRIPLAKTFLLGGIGVDLSDWRMTPPFVSPITFTMASRLLREKGVFEFLEAAKLVKARFFDVKFLLLGGLDDNPGSIMLNDLKPWIDLNIVDYPGHVDLREWLSITSVFVLPSYYREGVPRSTQEAMAMGRPIITTNVPGCRETVKNRVNGYLVSPRDSSALARAMINFIEKPDLIKSMGIASRVMAEDLFDVHKANSKLLKVMNL